MSTSEEQNKINEYKQKISAIEYQIDLEKKYLRDLIMSEEKRIAFKRNEKNNINELKATANDTNAIKKLNSMEEDFIRDNMKATLNFETRRDKINKTISDLENKRELYQEKIKELY